MSKKPNEDVVNQISSPDNSRGFTEAAKTVGVVKSIKGLIVAGIWAVIIIPSSIFFMTKGLPKIIGIPAIAVIAGIVIIEAIQLKRAYSVDTRPENDNNIEITVDPDEVLEHYIAGIWRYGSGAGSYSVLGTGKNRTPENCLLITNKNIWAVTVPLEGAGKIISGTDISMWQWITMREDIEKMLKEMINIMTLEELIKACGAGVLIPKGEIAKFKTSEISNGVTFVMKNRKKFSYSIRNKEDYERAKSMLGSLI